jgi:hypothetical protein
MRGHGTAQLPVIVKIDSVEGRVSQVDLSDVPFASASITNAPADDDRSDTLLVEAPEGEEVEIAGRTLRIARPSSRTSTVTDLAYADGTVLVAGMSNEEFSSNLRRIPFAFGDEMLDNSLQIFHVSHDQYETAAPIRTFIPYNGGSTVLASYTCTPVVQFFLKDLDPGTQAIGRTVADLGPMNQPIDMVSFTSGDEEFLVISNTHHPVTKLACRDIDRQEPLTQPKSPPGRTVKALPSKASAEWRSSTEVTC